MLELRAPTRTAAVLLLVLAAAATPGAAQAPPAQEVLAFSFEHASATDAVYFVRHLLSRRGSVELQPGGNTLVVRDAPSVVAEVRAMLERLDRPPRQLRIEIDVLRAGPGGDGDGEASPEMVERLRGLLRYDDYALLAQAGVSSREGEEVTYTLGRGYRVSFKVGNLLADERLRLDGFRITEVAAPASANKSRRPARQLIHTHLNLWKDQQFALVLSQDEGDDGTPEALLVAIRFRLEPADDPSAENAAH